MTSQDKEILRQCCSDQLDQISTKDEIFVTEKMNVFTMVSNLIPCFASSSDARGSKFAPSRNFPKKHDKKHVFFFEECSVRTIFTVYSKLQA